ncbi:uncharacterized protein LOC116304888 [Actinia tenebrosa]|uniref:Uncharacterized protein LOC116304888 n=1 Tax=Actinia tenebrosa TaxID=6105 RepID=A0A6P8ITJ1_ACTTE|nr:uncharacterized protein LOC116304888 [Actinia tenebrosa]
MDYVNHDNKIESDADSDSNSIDKSLREQTTVTAIGKTKTFAGLEREEWLFVTISLVNIIITVGFTIKCMVDVHSNSPDFTFAIILLVNAAFCFFYAIHGVLREREFEIYAYIAAATVVFTYIIINMAVKPNHITAIKWARFGTILVFAPFNIYYGIVVARGFGFLEFKTVGAVVALQKMYRKAGIFSCLLKFDFQLAISLAVLVIYNPILLNLTNKVILGVGIPFQFIWSVLGWIMMRKELKYLVLVFIPASLVEPGYIIYRLDEDIRNWESNTNGTSKGNMTAISASSTTNNDKDTLIYCFIVVAAIALLVRVLVLIALKFVVDNFGKGLRESVYNLPVSDDQPPLLPRKRDIAKCCGIVCCGPLG